MSVDRADDRDIRRGLLTAEDEALKAKLSNIKVPGRTGPVRVPVYFGMPAPQKQREYPYIQIDLIDVEFAADRAHSAQIVTIDSWPSEYPTFGAYAAANGIPFNEETQSAKSVWWHPYNLYFQVTTHARYTQQDRAMLQTLLRTPYLPMDGWGFLHVPADQSLRHLITNGYSTTDHFETVGEEQLRVFSKVFNIVVTADMPPENPLVYYKVLQVQGELYAAYDDEVNQSWINT